MFFSKLIAFAAFPFLAFALPGDIDGTTTTITVAASAAASQAADQCSTGTLQCCNTVTSTTSEAATSILGLLGIVVGDVASLVGLGCSPISILGIGINGCSSNAVCCEDNDHNDLISLGCVIITI